jgi:hypothetical protein
MGHSVGRGTLNMALAKPTASEQRCDVTILGAVAMRSNFQEVSRE